MSPSSRTEESIFAAALERQTPEERAAYLDGACGEDRALRQRVEELIRSHEQAGNFLNRPPVPPPATVDYTPITEGPGARIGPYKLLQLIGEGGMGVVYLAEQERPVRRKVALKIIKPGMDSREVVARFEAERQALAMMDHINIAQVLDAGTTDSGRPYFVMELIHGVPITTYCDENRLSLRERLELFVPVCLAIQHAHQKGIIHRDIKPSNVLVTMYDDRPVPKVIDFGVAKAVEQRLTERTLFTRYGAIVGTFEHMSPEQAEMNAFGVDTRSDVYSLGVLLYELLTGTTPLERRQLREAALGEVVRMIKEEEPPRPSVRLSTSDTRAKVAAARKTEPAKLSRLVRGELDWIVMRCLEKDRTRRYDTASGLARDVERYLRDEPVEARPPSACYRFRKMARRNKVALMTAALVGLALILGTVISTWQAILARKAEGEAEMARNQSAEQRDAALQAEQDANDKAGQLEQMTRDLRAEKERLERALANARVNQAHAAWRDGNLSVAHDLLESCPKEQRSWAWQHVKCLCSGQLYTMHGHTGPVTCVAFSPDGRLLASGSGDSKDLSKAGEVRIWEASGRPVLVVKHQASPVTGVAFSPDGEKVVTGGGGFIRVWDVRTGKMLLSLKGLLSLDRMELSPDGKLLVCGGQSDGSLKVWDALTGDELWAIPQPDQRASSLAFSHAGQRLALAIGETVHIRDSATGKQLLSLEGQPRIDRMRFSGDGLYLAATNYLAVQVWDLRAGKLMWDLNKQQGRVDNLVFSPDGKRLALTVGSTVRIHDSATGAQRLAFKSDAGAVPGMIFSPDGRCLALRCDDRTVRLWDSHTARELLTCKGHSNTVTELAFSPDGRYLVSGSEDATLRMWDVRGGPERALKGHAGVVNSVAFSPDGGRYASAGEDRTVRVRDSATGRELFALEGHRGPVNAVVFCPDGRLLASVSGDPWNFDEGGEIRTWDSRTGEPLLNLSIHVPVLSLAFSPDGRQFVWGGHGGHVHLLDARTGKEEQSFGGHIDRVHSVAFSRDGRRLASADAFGVLQMWDPQTGEPRWGKQFVHPALESMGMTFSPDSQLFAWGDGRTIWIVDSDSGELQRTLDGHTRWLSGIAFSPDGQRLVSADQQTVRLWDMSNGQEILALREPDRVTDVVFSPDGRYLASASHDGTVRLRDTLSVLKMPSLNMVPFGGSGVAISPDGQTIALGASLYDARTVRHLRSFQKGEDAPALSVAFSSDGKRLAVGSGYVEYISDEWWGVPYSHLRVWDVESGQIVFDMETPHNDRVCSVALSPDGKRLASGGDDHKIRLWDLETGKELSPPLVGHAHWVINLAFDPDGDTLWSEDRLGHIKAWDPATGKEKAIHERPVFDRGPRFAYSPDRRRMALIRDSVQMVDLPTEEDYAQRRRFSRPDPSWHRVEADDAEQAGQWFAAVFHLDRLAGLGDTSLELYQRRGRAHAEMGQWEQASADFAKAADKSPDDIHAWYSLALTQLGAGRVDDYRKTCARMLDRVRQRSDAPLAGLLFSPAPGDCLSAFATVDMAASSAWQRMLDRLWAVRASTLHADAVPDVAGLLSLTWDPGTRAAVLHRAGRNDEAADLLADAEGTTGLLYLGLVEHGRGQSKAAREALERAARLLDAPGSESTNQRNARKIPWQEPWEERFEDALLRREVESLIQRREP